MIGKSFRLSSPAFFAGRIEIERIVSEEGNEECGMGNYLTVKSAKRRFFWMMKNPPHS